MKNKKKMDEKIETKKKPKIKIEKKTDKTLFFVLKIILPKKSSFKILGTPYAGLGTWTWVNPPLLRIPLWSIHLSRNAINDKCAVNRDEIN